jgi:hypothetical protein
MRADHARLLAWGRPRAAETRWNQRLFVVTGALLSGLALPVTGLVDRLAGAAGGAATPAGWSIVHAAPGVLFAVFCAWHAVLNRHALARHLRARLPAGVLPVAEVLGALALVGGVLALTVTHALAGP